MIKPGQIFVRQDGRQFKVYRTRQGVVYAKTRKSGRGGRWSAKAEVVDLTGCKPVE